MGIGDTLRILAPEPTPGMGDTLSEVVPPAVEDMETPPPPAAPKCICDSNEVYGGHRDNCPRSSRYKQGIKGVFAKTGARSP